MVTNLKNGTMLNKFYLIFFLLLLSCSTNKSFSTIGKKEFTEKIKFENPTLYGYLVNSYLVHRSNMPELAVAKHNTAIHTALMNPNNGVTYAWKHTKRETWPDQEFFGVLKIVSSTNDNRGYCRTWIEKIARDRKYKNYSLTTACLNGSQTKYILADEIFYDQIK